MTTTLQPIVIFGTGGFGREVHELIEDINDYDVKYEIVGFLDGDRERHGTVVHGLRVHGDAAWLDEHPGMSVAIGIGGPVTKARIAAQLRAAGATFPALVHPRALVGRRVRLGEGAIVCAGTIITTDIDVGAFNTINIDVTIGHDSILEDYVTVAPGVHISGNVRVGTGTDLGTGAAIIQGVTIGEWSIVGAGAVVNRDVPANVTAVGVPATVIKQREPGWQLR